MSLVVTNNAVSKLIAAITSASTSITITGGTGVLFPSTAAGDTFNLSLVDSSNNIEIVTCTNRNTDIFTITRAQEGTTARAFSVGDRVALTITAAAFNSKADKTALATSDANLAAHIADTSAAHVASSIGFNPVGNIAATNVQAAIVELDTEKLSNSPTLSALSAILQLIYPIGSLYFNAAVSTNPATLLGFGTWVAYATGRALVGIDSSNTLMDTLGETFGQADTVLPVHDHNGLTGEIDLSGTFQTNNAAVSGAFSLVSSFGGAGQNAQPNYTIRLNGNHAHYIAPAGVNSTNKNYQPSIAIYIWQRTA